MRIPTGLHTIIKQMKPKEFKEKLLLYLLDMKVASFGQLKDLFGESIIPKTFYQRLGRLRKEGIISNFNFSDYQSGGGVWYALPKALKEIINIYPDFADYYIPDRPDLKNIEHDIVISEVRVNFEKTFKGQFEWSSERYLRAQWWAEQKKQKKQPSKYKMKHPKYMADAKVVFTGDEHPMGGKVIRIEHENTIKSKTRYEKFIAYLIDECKDQRILIVCNSKARNELENKIQGIAKEHKWDINNISITIPDKVLGGLWEQIDK